MNFGKYFKKHWLVIKVWFFDIELDLRNKSSFAYICTMCIYRWQVYTYITETSDPIERMIKWPSKPTIKCKTRPLENLDLINVMFLPRYNNMIWWYVTAYGQNVSFNPILISLNWSEVILSLRGVRNWHNTKQTNHIIIRHIMYV